MNPPDALFALEPLPVPVKLSADRKRTQRHHDALAKGQHPLMGGPVDPAHKCGDCLHHFEHTRNQTWHKCDLHATRGAGTDIRVSWPACSAFKPREETAS